MVARSDAGFSVLEVLVGLVVASLVTIAIGGLFQLTASANTALSENDRVQRALLQLQQILQRTGERLSSVVDVANAEGFALTSNTVTWSRPAAFSLTSSPLGSRAQFGGQMNDTDLSMFDEVRLQYLVQTNGSTAWRDPGEPMLDVLAARLVLKLGPRIWRPLIWIASPHDLSSLTMQEP